MPDLATGDQSERLIAEPAVLDGGRRFGSAHKRLFWTFADQGLSSLQNAALSIILAKAVDPRQFGAFSIAFTIYGLVVAVSDSVGGQVLVIRFAAAQGASRQRATGASTGVAVTLGGVATIGLLIAAVIAASDVRTALFVTALVMPGLLLQDAWRTVFITRGTPFQAFLNDAIWLLLQAAAIGSLVGTGVRSTWPYLVAWGAAACIAAGLGIVQSGTLPRPLTAPRFVRQHKGVAAPSLISSMAAIGSSQLSLLLIAGYGGLLDIAAFRGCQTLLGPLNVVGFATTAFAVPELVRREPSRKQLLRAAAVISAGMLSVNVAWGAVLLLLPHAAGQALLGQTWDVTRSALPGMILFTSCIGLAVGPGVIIDALNRPAYSTAVSLVVSPLTVALALVGLHLGHARGAAFGFAVAAGCGVVPSWLLAVRCSRLGRKPVPDDPAGAALATGGWA